MPVPIILYLPISKDSLIYPLQDFESLGVTAVDHPVATADLFNQQSSRVTQKVKQESRRLFNVSTVTNCTNGVAVMAATYETCKILGSKKCKRCQDDYICQSCVGKKPANQVLVRRKTSVFNPTEVNNESPISTNVYCFWCSHQFNNTPVFLPIKEDGGIFTVAEIFCSFQCALAHVESNAKYFYIRPLLALMYKITTGNRLSDFSVNIKKAPARQALEIFGGIMGIDEFRANSNDTIVNVLPVIHNSVEICSLGNGSSSGYSTRSGTCTGITAAVPAASNGGSLAAILGIKL